MSREKFRCMAIECTEEVERDPFNFGTGFCAECKKQYNENVLTHILL